MISALIVYGCDLGSTEKSKMFDCPLAYEIYSFGSRFKGLKLEGSSFEIVTSIYDLKG